jgi:hypothetical protein
VQRGFTRPPAFYPIAEHEQSMPQIYQREQYLLTAPAGHYFDVITNGWGTMFSYNDRVAPRDRWAIIMYIRALQLSQHAPADELSPELRAKLDAPTTTPSTNPAKQEETP